jgi:hypothetical protein
LWRKAEAGESEFLPVFLPWSLDAGYSREVGPDFQIASDESGLVDLYGLTKEQLAWRRAKIAQLGSAEYFAQEYPLNAAEAFISASFDSFIPPELVIKARKEKVEDPYGPLVIGVDSLQADLVSTGYKFNSAGQLVLESNQDMRRRGLPSPDEADAVALCFADAGGFPRNKEFHRSLKERYQDAYA